MVDMRGVQGKGHSVENKVIRHDTENVRLVTSDYKEG